MMIVMGSLNHLESLQVLEALIDAKGNIVDWQLVYLAQIIDFMMNVI